jgi:hypothetical protein
MATAATAPVPPPKTRGTYSVPDEALDPRYDVKCPYDGGASYAAELRECYASATSWYDVGHAVGTAMRDTIQTSVGSSSSVARLEAWAATPEGGAIVDGFRALHEEIYPQHMEEVRGASRTARSCPS